MTENDHAESKNDTDLAKFDAEIIRILEEEYDAGHSIPVGLKRVIMEKRQVAEPSLEYALKQFFSKKQTWGWDSERMNKSVAEIIAVVEPFLSPTSSEEEQ